MNAYLARLNPSERRFVVGVALLLFMVVNLFWVWPHFSDWGTLRSRLNGARGELDRRTTVLQQAERLKPELARMETEGASVPAEDQSIEFMRTIQMQAGQSGVGITGYGHQTTHTNDQFFTEQSQTITCVTTEKQLIDFLYNLGAGNSLIRVRSLSVHPDPNRQQLNANVTLVASYQKNPRSRTAAPATKAPPAKPATAPTNAPTVKPATPKKK